MHKWRLLLLPLSLIYGMIVSLRTLLFRYGILKRYSIPGASVCVGNITVGGTGKSPMTSYIAELLQEYGPVILSRGYGRSTNGPRIATPADNALTIGDEPYMYFKRFNEGVPVVVAEKRKIGVGMIRSKFPDAPIILDDAFQHLHVKAGMNLILMTWDRPVFRDYPFPAGNLREPRSGLRRADIIVVTKVPEHLSDQEKADFCRHLRFPASRIFFSGIVYGDIVPLFNTLPTEPEIVLLVTGIANPEPLRRHLAGIWPTEVMAFPDHHVFTAKDIQVVRQKVATFAGRRCAVITTEKDAVRLTGLSTLPEMQEIPWFYQQMTINIDRRQEFNDLLLKYVTGTNERGS